MSGLDFNDETSISDVTFRFLLGAFAATSRRSGYVSDLTPRRRRYPEESPETDRRQPFEGEADCQRWRMFLAGFLAAREVMVAGADLMGGLRP